jgi:hypothetical protein
MDGNDVFIDITSTGQLSSNCDEAQHCCDDEEDREGQVPYVEHFNDDSTSTSDRSTIHCNNNNTNDLEPNDHASWWSHSLSDSALIHNVRNDTAATHNNSSSSNNNIYYAYDFSGIVRRTDRKVRVVETEQTSASSANADGDIPIIEWTEFHPNWNP